MESLLSPVHEEKKATVVTPTISLMQDQVKYLDQKGINKISLRYEQLNKAAEDRAFKDDGINLVDAIPEWIAERNEVKSTSTSFH